MTKSEITIYCTDISNKADSPSFLLEAARAHTGLADSELKVIRENGKKPYFALHPEICFSVSHSGNCWICAFGSKDIGADVQFHGSMTRHTRLADRFFHPDEADAVKCADDPEQVFFRIWSRKEAAVKMLGIGIDANFSAFSTLGETSSLLGRNIFISDIILPVTDAYSAAAAFSGQFVSKIIRF